MTKYGQYCPVAKSLEILGDRWTLLIVRDMLCGTRHFNALERGLPGISRALLATRMKELQRAGIIEKRLNGSGRQSTEYLLTQAGLELINVIMSLRQWGETWAFGDPTPEDLDPVLLMWWMRSRVNVDQLPAYRVVAQFDLHGFDSHGLEKGSFWLVMATEDVTLCLTDPGYEINLLITADLAAFFKLFGGRMSYQAVLNEHKVRVEGTSSLVRAFPGWFGWSTSTPSESIESGTSRISIAERIREPQ